MIKNFLLVVGSGIEAKKKLGYTIFDDKPVMPSQVV